MQQVTVKEVLQATIDILNGINIPVSMLDQIGNPIKVCANNLTECVKAIEAAEPKAEEEESGEEQVGEENA